MTTTPVTSVKNQVEKEDIADLARTTIGKFQIQQLIGRGATAAVYLGEDPFSGNSVAIKVAHQSVFNDPVNGLRFLKMFMNEASLAGKLRHPTIVSVFDAGIESDIHYIVMEYVSGGTLKGNCTPESLLSINNVVEIIFKCANALEYAHSQGCIHRDIKPANLLLAEGTDVKISDFGTALLADSELTQIVDAIGTPNYMSPEQIAGKELNHQTDIYSLGVVMYQLLCGKVPFKAKNQYELLQKITKESPIPIDNVRLGIPEEVVEIVNRCLQKKPGARYPFWSDLAEDLSQVHETLELTSPVISDTYKFNTLKSLNFFDEFTDVEIWEVLRISRWHRFKKGKALLSEGKIGKSFYILATGHARIMKSDRFLGMIEKGQCFGEMAYIYGRGNRRTASVISSSNVVVVKISPESLHTASDQLQTKFSRVLLRTLASRLEKTSEMATTL